MSPPKPLPDDTAGNDQDTRTRLLMSAGPIFAKLGYQRATIREISCAANVNIASVAYYFGDKMGLYRAVIDQVRQTRERRFPTPHTSSQPDSNVSPEQTLAQIVHTMLSRMIKGDQYGWESQLLMRELDEPTLAFRDMVQEFFRPLYNQLKSAVIGLMDCDVPDHVAEQFALSVVGQCLYYRIGRGVIDILIPEAMRKQHFDIDNLCRHITATTIAAAQDPNFHLNKERLDWPSHAVETKTP